MKELDLLLGRWMDERHAAASSEQRAAFASFLGLPDPDMARYLLGHEEPPAEHRAVRDELLELAGGHASLRAAGPPDPRA